MSIRNVIVSTAGSACLLLVSHAFGANAETVVQGARSNKSNRDNSSSSFSRNDGGERLSFAERRKKRREAREKRMEEWRSRREERREKFHSRTAESRERREKGKEAADESSGGGNDTGGGSSGGSYTKPDGGNIPGRPIGPEDLARKLLIIGDIHQLNGRSASARESYRKLLDRFPESKFCEQARRNLVELAAE